MNWVLKDKQKSARVGEPQERGEGCGRWKRRLGDSVVGSVNHPSSRPSPGWLVHVEPLGPFLPFSVLKVLL